ncbi:MAG: IclR family transcriptional regulator [Mesorhizobium sp.]
MDGPLARYHAVLVAVAKTPGGLPSAELARATGFPRSTAHRLATSLHEFGYLHQTVPGHYELGPALDEILSQRLLASQQAHAFAPALRRLTLALGETAFCAKLDCGSVAIVDALVPTERDRAHIYPGLGERPLDRCSSSRAILAFREEAEVDHWLSREGRANSADRASLHDMLVQVRSNGYSVCDGEIDEGIFSIACPVYLEPFGVLYSIGVTGPAARMKERSLDEMVAAISEAAREASVAVTADVTTRSNKTRRKTRNSMEEK